MPSGATIFLRALPRADEHLPFVPRCESKRATVPVTRAFQAPARSEHARVIERATEVAPFCRAAIPLSCFALVACGTPAFFQAASQKIHRARMALIGRAAIPKKRRRSVARDAISVEEKMAEIVLCPGIASFGRKAVPDGGPRRVGYGTPAMLATAAQHVLRIQALLVRSAREPGQRRGFVFRNAFAREKHAAEQDLRLDNAQTRSRRYPRRGIAGMFAQNARKLIARHHGECSHAPQIAFVAGHGAAQRRTRLW